jgi:hypothetical protein
MTDPWDEYEAWHFKHIEAVDTSLSALEARHAMNECLDEYARIKRELFLDGFCDYVIKQGYGAAAPNKYNGKPESWQQCGRRLWGTKHFDEAMKKAIERKRGARTSARISPGSSPS